MVSELAQTAIFKFQSDSINTMIPYLNLVMSNNFKFQSDSINTINSTNRFCE